MQPQQVGFIDLLAGQGDNLGDAAQSDVQGLMGMAGHLCIRYTPIGHWYI